MTPDRQPPFAYPYNLENDMDRNFGRALSLVLKHEGGFVDHPRDPGGATNKGVTIATFRRYVKPGGTVADLKAITNEQIATVYKSQYWDAVKGDDLPSGVDYAVFDYAVNSGPSRAAKYLQAIVGVKQDGRVGPITLAAVRAMDAREVINALCDNRLAFLKRLSTWGDFGKGWSRRVADVRAHALDMVMPNAPIPTPKPLDNDNPPSPSPAPTGNAGKVAAGAGIMGILALLGMAWDKVSGWVQSLF